MVTPESVLTKNDIGALLSCQNRSAGLWSMTGIPENSLEDGEVECLASPRDHGDNHLPGHPVQYSIPMWQHRGLESEEITYQQLTNKHTMAAHPSPA